MKDLRHLWIHLDEQVFLDRHLVVSSFNLLFDPLGELFVKDSGANIGEPLLRCLR